MKTIRKTIDTYIDAIVSGKKVSGKLEQLAVSRFIDDCKTGIDRGLYFDEKAAAKVINFYKFIRHTKGEFEGKVFELEPWQQFLLWNLFGWKQANGYRRFNKSYAEVARKNGKSALAAPVGLYGLTADKESGAEIYSAATTRDQAKIVFKEAVEMVKKSKAIKSISSIYTNSITIEATASFFKPLSSDANTLDGLNVHYGIVDEYHAHKTSEVYDVLTSSQGARRQPLMFTITTAGFNLSGPCFTENQLCRDILQGIKKQDNYLAMIYTLDEGDDWRDEASWYKANPNLGVSKRIDYMRKEFLDAVNNPTKEVAFKTKHLNIWCASSIQFISDEKWMNQPARRSLNELHGQRAWAGLDLSQSIDLTALVFVIPRENGIDDVVAHFWIPESKVEQMQDRVDYQVWASMGYITITPGDVIDIEIMSKETIEMLEQYDIQELAIDPAKAYHGVTQNIQKNTSIVLTQFRQGFVSMDTPTKEIQKQALSGRLAHGGDPVLRWCNSNVEIARDSADNIKIDKKRARNRVDGMVALVMAKGAQMGGENNNSLNNFYERNDVRTL